MGRISGPMISGRSRLSVSVGVATLTPKLGQSSLVLVDLADQGLYRAKNNGRNQVAMAEVDTGP